MEESKEDLFDISVDPTDCNDSVSCPNCGTTIGYCTKDIWFEDFAIICEECKGNES